MKASVQLRKFSPKAAIAKVYFRVRDGKIDMKVASNLTIDSNYWDSDKLGYKAETPEEVATATKRSQFNKTIQTVLASIYADYYEGADIEWLNNKISSLLHTDEQEPSAEQDEQEGNESPLTSDKEAMKQMVRHTAQSEQDTKTAVEYFELYLKISDFNDWHRQAQTAVMQKVKRFEAWLQLMSGDADYKLYLAFFDKQGTQTYLDYISHEHEYRDENPEHFAQFKLAKSIDIRPMSPNTLSCSAKRLFMFLNWCVKNGYLKSADFRNVTLDQEVYGTPYYLTIEERDKVFYHDFSQNPRLDFHLDMFLFLCLFGCLFNDLNILTCNHIVEAEYIEYIPHKNLLHGKTDLVRCPLCDKAKEILDRLDPEMPYLFVRYCNDLYRTDIKKILKEVGIDRKVTVLDPLTRKAVQKPLYEVAATHLARRTFIGNIYRQVHDPALIASLTGHCEQSKSFARYRAIDDDVKRDVLKLIQ